MLNIKKPQVKYRVLPNDEIQLSNVKDVGGDRITITMRQAVPDDLTHIEKWQKDPEVTPKQVDERTVSLLITKWGDRDGLTSLEVAQLPIETRGVLLQIFQNFCMPSAELVEDVDEETEVKKHLPAK